MLIKQVEQKNVIFANFGILKILVFKYEPYLCNGCRELMQNAMSFNDIDIVYVKWSAYRIHFWYMSKDDAIRIMSGSNLVDKKVFCHFFVVYKKSVI